METPQFALRPSSAGMWVRCAGHASLARKYPELPGDFEAREEGTAAHWVAYEVGNNREVPVGTKAPNGIEVTEEMHEWVAEYLEVLRSWQLPVYMESQVACPSIHAQCGGTVDAWAWDAVNRILYVGDLKTGRMPVDAYECWQLLAYVRGVLDYLQAIHGKFTEHFRVVMVIVQPRDYGNGALKTWRVSSENLIPYMTTLRLAAKAAVDFAETGDGEYTAGSHCYYCSANGNCGTYQRATLQLMDVATQHGAHDLQPIQIDTELRHIDRAIKMLQARQEALELQVEHQIGKGVFFPHFAMGAGSGKTVWKEGKEKEVAALARMLGTPIEKEMALITPRQVRLLRKIPDALIDSFTEFRPGKTSIRRVSPNHADKLFNQDK